MFDLDSDEDDMLLEALEEVEMEQTGGASAATIKLTLHKQDSKTVKKFGVSSTNYKASFSHEGATDHVSVTEAFSKGLGDALQDVTKGMKPTDKIRLFMKSNKLASSIQLPLMNVGELQDPANAVQYILDTVTNILNSNEQFELNDSFQLNILHVEMPFGKGKSSGKRKRGTEQYADWLKKKHCVIRIVNDDELCCARALVTAKAKVDESEEYGNLRKGRIIQTVLAEQLHQDAGVPLAECGLTEIGKF